MYSFIKGIVNIFSDNIVILDNNGIGYEINISRKLKLKEGDNITLYTYFIQKEDYVALYGFKTKEEKRMFITLLSAQGVGPKLALEVLTEYSVTEIINILFTKDIKSLKQVSGMGIKKAEKLLFDLRDKIEKIDINLDISTTINSNINDAIKGLMSLGFSNIEASKAILKIENKENISIEMLITNALKNLSKL